ncbi:MAG: helix-turn-helix domain-containing protein [Raoultibacter sp.]
MLSRDLIIDTTYRMIEEHGVSTFTMRALGVELGVSAMACYSHFDSREELLSEVSARFMATLDTDPIPGERWDDTLRRTMQSIHETFREHPNLGELTDQPEVGLKGIAPHTKKIVMLHLNQGMPKAIFSRTWAIVDAYMGGFFINEIGIARLEKEGQLNEDSVRELEEWELTVRQAYTDDSFKSGIEIIIAGVRNLAAPDPCEWYTPLDPQSTETR